MCHQSVGLIQSVIEQSGIPTASVTLLEEVTREVRPPRALFVDLPLGYPLGHPRDAAIQRSILSAVLELLTLDEPLPILRGHAP